jgi:hypothetical protein
MPFVSLNESMYRAAVILKQRTKELSSTAGLPILVRQRAEGFNEIMRLS